MTIAAITGKMTIRAKHPVREDFSGCTTGSGGPYYPTKGDAVSAYSAALAEYSLCFDPDDMICMMGDDGRIEVDVYTDELECAVRVGRALLMWHRMEYSGRWEFTGYLA
jgi:hypothetical protein